MHQNVIQADLSATRSFPTGVGGSINFISGIHRVTYNFLNIENINGLSYDLGQHFTLSCGLGFVGLYKDYKNQDYLYSYIPYKADIADIGDALAKDVVKKYNINFGYSIAFHYKSLYLTARYQENLTNDSKGFEYVGTKYPLNGQTSSINLDLGYRFSW
jgi:hypothetical protein